MNLDAILRAHAYMRVERPPLLWEADTDEIRLLPLLGEMIVVGLGRGNALGDLVLNVANVTIEPDLEEPDTARYAPGDYVAVTVRGAGNWNPEWVWPRGAGAAGKVYSNIESALPASGAAYAYSRDLGEHGSLTVLFPRAVANA